MYEATVGGFQTYLVFAAANGFNETPILLQKEELVFCPGHFVSNDLKTTTKC